MSSPPYDSEFKSYGNVYMHQALLSLETSITEAGHGETKQKDAKVNLNSSPSSFQATHFSESALSLV